MLECFFNLFFLHRSATSASVSCSAGTLTTALTPKRKKSPTTEAADAQRWTRSKRFPITINDFEKDSMCDFVPRQHPPPTFLEKQNISPPTHSSTPRLLRSSCNNFPQAILFPLLSPKKRSFSAVDFFPKWQKRVFQMCQLKKNMYVCHVPKKSQQSKDLLLFFVRPATAAAPCRKGQ